MISAVKTVRDHSKLEGLHKLAILGLATHAHKDGSNAYISQSKIAKREGISRTVVVEAFQQAAENGEITLTGRTRRGVGIYSFTPFIDREDGVQQTNTPASTYPSSRQVPGRGADSQVFGGRTEDVQEPNTYIRGTEEVIEQAPEQASEVAVPQSDQFINLKQRVEEAKQHGL